MSYGNPSIASAIDFLKQKGVKETLLIPLYPHYAMSTFESVIIGVQKAMLARAPEMKMNVVAPYFNEQNYIGALASSAAPYLEWNYDHLLVSYHGLPERHLTKTDPTGSHCLQRPDCCSVPSPAHKTCYRHQAFVTTDAFAKKAQIPAEKYSISFQSRLGRQPWLQPYTDMEIRRLAESGVKRLLVMCPSFVSDCLETLEEIGIRGKELFLESGGEEFRMIRCLNDHPAWIETLRQYVAGNLVSADSRASN